MLSTKNQQNRQMGNKLRAGRRLGMEWMEERRMMAGDVAVDVIGGQLNIDGDSLGNAVQVSKLENGNLEIRGLTKDGALTKINGGYDAYTIPASQVQSMDIDLGDGNDDLYLGSQQGATNANKKILLQGDLNIRMQGGDDFAKLQHVMVLGKTDITMDRDTSGPQFIGYDYSGGDDTLEITSGNFQELNINTRDGEDTVDFSTSFDSYGRRLINVARGVDIQTGDDGDTVNLDHLYSLGDMIVQTGDGADTLDVNAGYAYGRFMFFDTGAGNDTVHIENVNLYWNNETSMYSSSPDTDFYVYTGDGQDTVNLHNVDVMTGNLEIHTGNQNDTVELDDVKVRDLLFADLGDGDDTLAIDRASAAVAQLYGGRNTRFGGDSLGLSNSRFGSLRRNGFER